MIISFAWTTPAMEARRKFCTRRFWDDRYARRFFAGQVHDAYDRQPRYRGKPICKIRLTETPYKEQLCLIPEEDWKREGFAYLQSIGAKVGKVTPVEIWNQWKDSKEEVWVVRFEYVQNKATL